MFNFLEAMFDLTKSVQIYLDYELSVYLLYRVYLQNCLLDSEFHLHSQVFATLSIRIQLLALWVHLNHN